LEETSIRVVDEAGRVVKEMRAPSEPRALAEVSHHGSPGSRSTLQLSGSFDQVRPTPDAKEDTYMKLIEHGLFRTEVV
jgi:hypothetical protein